MSSITFYKPTPKSNGSAASFSCRKHQSEGINQCYMNIVKQVSWDASKRRASFKSNDPDNDIAIKFNTVELGGIARALAGKEDFSTVHQFDGTATSIKMSWYDRGGAKQFSVSVSKKGNKYGISLTPNECYALSKFCDDTIIKLCEDKE